MNFYLNLFLSNNNLKYEVESSNGIIPTVENKNDRILERESRTVDNVRLNIVMFNLAYPKASSSEAEITYSPSPLEPSGTTL